MERLVRPTEGLRALLLTKEPKVAEFLGWLGSGKSEAAAVRKASRMRLSLHKMILDCVVEQCENSRWVCGPLSACSVKAFLPRSRPTESLATLSHDAVRFGISCPEKRKPNLIKRICLYNSLPLSHEALEANKIVSFIEKVAREVILLDREWEMRLKGGYWSYQRRNSAPAGALELFVSPHPSGLVQIMPLLLHTVLTAGVQTFRIGAGVLGMERPDKIVMRFDDFSALEIAAGEIALFSRHFPAQGVPFTSSIDKSGMLSWAPGPSTLSIGWRKSIARNIADSASMGKELHANPRQMKDYCIARLEAMGVDTLTWVPKRTLKETPPTYSPSAAARSIVAV